MTLGSSIIQWALSLDHTFQRAAADEFANLAVQRTVARRD